LCGTGRYNNPIRKFFIAVQFFCGWVVMMSGLPRNYGFPQNLRSWFQDIRI